MVDLTHLGQSAIERTEEEFDALVRSHALDLTIGTIDTAINQDSVTVEVDDETLAADLLGRLSEGGFITIYGDAYRISKLEMLTSDASRKKYRLGLSVDVA